MRLIFLTLTLVCCACRALAFDVAVNIDTEQGRAPISPLIYGTNVDLPETNMAFYRSGGNRLTGYNWENNYSHAGNDYFHQNDQFLPSVSNIPFSEWLVPGRVLTAFHDSVLARGADSLITLQMAGYVSADDEGPVSAGQAAPSSRWKEVVYAKGSAFSLSPDTSDNFVYIDEMVNFLVQTYGPANTANGVRAYSLDNEPALWVSTHPRIHPQQPTAQELVNKSIALATAVKNVDPSAEIFGPALYGYAAYLDFQGAPDWGTVGAGYDWFIDYYLDQLRIASNSAGMRLLDVLDVHWYPEAIGDGQRIVFGSPPYTPGNQQARIQAPRSLWDASYQEDNWIGQFFHPIRLIPDLQDAIDQYYPGTKLAFTEFSYGGESDVSGGIAMADVLGIFGKYGVHAACYWQLNSVSNPAQRYVDAAYKIFRNYDGANGAFGGTRVQATTNNVPLSSVYAAIAGDDASQLHIIVINKSFTEDLNGTFNITSPRNYTSGGCWAFDATTAVIAERAAISAIQGNSFAYSLPPLAVGQLVLTAAPQEPPANVPSSSWTLY